MYEALFSTNFLLLTFNFSLRVCMSYYKLISGNKLALLVLSNQLRQKTNYLSSCPPSIVTYLNPTMGYSLQILHFAWCLAVSAAARRCSTGSHTRDCGSSFSHSRKWLTWISGRPLAFKYIIHIIINMFSIQIYIIFI